MNSHPSPTSTTTTTIAEPLWFAIKTRQDFRAADALRRHCDEVFFPTELVKRPGRRPRFKAAIPHVVFIKTTRENALQLERQGHTVTADVPVPFWIYRYPTDNEIQVISQKNIDLLHLLTADDASRCEIFNKTDFRTNDRVVITDGMFKDYEGYVLRVKRNRHVLVQIEGICTVMLPFIHPDLLEKV